MFVYFCVIEGLIHSILFVGLTFWVTRYSSHQQGLFRECYFIAYEVSFIAYNNSNFATYASDLYVTEST